MRGADDGGGGGSFVNWDGRAPNFCHTNRRLTHRSREKCRLLESIFASIRRFYQRKTWENPLITRLAMASPIAGPSGASSTAALLAWSSPKMTFSPR